jgi:methylmalonyl-CoA mutase, N-terminal domain
MKAADTVDPLGGSHVIEHLTDEIEARALALMASIDGMGGAIAAIESGWMQSQIAESAYRYQREIETQQRVVVGVNAFADDGTGANNGPRFKVDPAVEAEQIARLRAFRAARDAPRAHAMMAQLESEARYAGNLMPVLIACVEASVTVGEIGTVLRGVFGEYRAPSAI